MKVTEIKTNEDGIKFIEFLKREGSERVKIASQVINSTNVNLTRNIMKRELIVEFQKEMNSVPGYLDDEIQLQIMQELYNIAKLISKI